MYKKASILFVRMINAYCLSDQSVPLHIPLIRHNMRFPLLTGSWRRPVSAGVPNSSWSVWPADRPLRQLTRLVDRQPSDRLVTGVGPRDVTRRFT